MSVLIGAILGALIGVLIVHKQIRDDWDHGFDYVAGAVIGGFLGFLLGWAVACKISVETTTCESEITLVSLQDNSSISGNFYLGSGRVDGKMKYVFYYESGDGFKMEQLDYKSVQIKYTTGKPRVITYRVCETDNPKNYWGVGTGIGDTWHVIEVPKGTIKNDYNLDAQ